MRPVNKRNIIIENGKPKIFKKYQRAKKYLIEDLGTYCSFCETKIPRAHLEVEHLYYKDKYTAFKNCYWNFLICCKTCNLAKGKQDLAATDVYLPHQANTFAMIKVLTSGVIVANPALPPAMKAKAEATISLFGLDREEGHPNIMPQDDRWQTRFDEYDLAMRMKRHFISSPQAPDDVEAIVNVAAFHSGWSIWLSVFEAFPAVKCAIIASPRFKGTCQTCFDANGTPTNRNGTDL